MQKLLTGILILFLLLVSSSGFADDGSKYRVLVLHSYNKGLTWTDNIQKGIENSLKSIDGQLNLKVEYMDSKIVKFDDTFKTKLYNLYKHKFSKSRFNVIISSDDNALTFLREHHEGLFPDTPIIFCGVNNIKIPNIIDRSMFSGILEISAERETLDLVLKLHPKTKKIVIICGNTPSGKARWKQIKRMFKDYPQVQFTRLDSSYSIAEIEEKVKNLGDDTIGIFATFYRDKTDKYFSLKEGVKRVSKASRRPLYTYHAQVLLHGTVGGKVLGGSQHGSLAAEFAKRIFGGEHTKDIPIIDKSLAQYMFNYKELARFGIDMSKLPKDSIITNRPFSFYKEYKYLVWGTLFIAFVLTLIIGALILNINKRKNAELEIKTQKTFIHNALDAQKDTFFVFDPLEGKALQWNKAFEDITGYTTDEITSLKAPHSYYSKEDLEKAGEYIEKVMKGVNGTVELELICKDGHLVPTEYSASITKDSEGNLQNLISIGRDISERKAAEKEKEELEGRLRQVYKMEAIGTLAGGIAHDFNNVLTAIIGYAEMIRYELPEFSPIINDIQEILRAGDRAKELVKHILTFSRKSGGDRVPIEIYLIVEEAIKLLRASIPTTIALEKSIDSRCGAIMANSTQIHQVIMNLGTNAAQAMDEKGGTIQILLGCTELTEKDLKNEPSLKPGQYAKLSVKDAGPGIDQSTIDRIFDPYFTTKEVGKGSGMGLAVVHGIVKSHGGMTSVESIVGKGATFNVFFPRVEEEVHLENDDQYPFPTGNERIMVVDDEVSVIDITKRRLELLGYQVRTEIDSMMALEIFRLNPAAFDLVITDQTMPNLTGEELAKEMINIKSNLPIILCTGYSSKIDAEKAFSLGISGFIMKPVDQMELALTIRQVLDGRESTVV